MRPLLWLRNGLNGLLIFGSLCAIPFSLLRGEGLLAGIGLALGYLMPWVGGMGMRGAYKIGDRGQKVVGFVLGTVCLVVGTWLLTLNSYSADAWWWGPVLFGWGFLTVTKSDAGERTSRPVPAELPSNLDLAQVIVSAYGAVLEAATTDPETHLVYPESKLPYPKPLVEASLNLLLQHAIDEEQQDLLKVGLLYLQDFVPDDEVASHPQEQGLQQVKALAKDLGVDYDTMATQQREVVEAWQAAGQPGLAPRRSDETDAERTQAILEAVKVFEANLERTAPQWERRSAAVQQVKERNAILAQVLHSAEFLGVSDDGHLRMALRTDFNRKIVEKSSNRALIEAQASVEFGRTVWLEATLAAQSASPSS